MKNYRFMMALLILFLLFSCAKNDFERHKTAADTPVAESTSTIAPAPVSRAGYAEAKKDVDKIEEQALPSTENLALRGRKLIREGTVELKVTDIEVNRAKLEEMVKTAGGFVSDVKYNRYTSSSQIELTLRLPAEGFTSFVKAVAVLGEIQNEQTNTTDVTDQWIDLNQRIATNNKLAARLEELIQNKSYQFKDLLEVERELARLRLDTERLEGQMRGMDDRISLSTLHIVMRQDVLQKIAPPDSVFAPLLNALENAGPRFQSSIRTMMKLFGGCLTLFVILIPWLIPPLLLVIVVVAVIKKSRKKKGAGPTPSK